MEGFMFYFQGVFLSRAVSSGYQPEAGLSLELLTVYGLKTGPDTVTVNGIAADYEYKADTKV